mmetsp:Transcript_46849/g.146188  ORF Transcript_46849/g.146188 Transcript_46849/m.146188 type:complete len:215 (-) Transcript_46849:211-855(-)|eukprot:CAMPEP_0118854006 /NCGR_PEP_ID=MMETSP1163-20130328/2371_1 /TAXON_ID=124430 /ORGANISM="Phaeomonas parva, Strain CCMP2877" /LENGTH=214 /DNA_ID=CAMNT_0006786651 /DNA_START=210 /DNA_END=854 /DNA_ORIENTATION=-
MSTLKTVVFLGSARNVVPAWGGDRRLGDRVLGYVVNALRGRTDVKHDVTVYDPLEVFGEGGALSSSGGELQTPQFMLGDPPAAMVAMKETIAAADCYVIVTPEYNHSIPPALSSMMGHFGGSNYSCKASGIVTYSPGPFGGARGAVALRPFLSELGCLPVSKLVCLANPTSMFDEDGSVIDPEARMLGQLPGMLDQLEWMATAMKNHRELVGTF